MLQNEIIELFLLLLVQMYVVLLITFFIKKKNKNCSKRKANICLINF